MFRYSAVQKLPGTEPRPPASDPLWQRRDNHCRSCRAIQRLFRPFRDLNCLRAALHRQKTRRLQPCVMPNQGNLGQRPEHQQKPSALQRKTIDARKFPENHPRRGRPPIGRISKPISWIGNRRSACCIYRDKFSIPVFPSKNWDHTRFCFLSAPVTRSRH